MRSLLQPRRTRALPQNIIRYYIMLTTHLIIIVYWYCTVLNTKRVDNSDSCCRDFEWLYAAGRSISISELTKTSRVSLSLSLSSLRRLENHSTNCSSLFFFFLYIFQPTQTCKHTHTHTLNAQWLNEIITVGNLFGASRTLGYIYDIVIDEKKKKIKQYIIIISHAPKLQSGNAQGRHVLRLTASIIIRNF